MSAVKNLPMQWQEHFRKLLNDELLRRKKTNPRYSMRSFGKEIGISIGGISKFLRGNLQLSAERAASIVIGFNLKPEERDYYLGLMGHPITRQTVPISDDNAVVFTNWLYFAVLHFFDLDVKIAPQEIARRLSVPPSEIEDVIASLLEKKFLQRLPSGELVKPEIHWTSGDGENGRVRDILQEYHRANLGLAARAVSEVPSEKRQISTTVFSGNSSQLAAARAEIMALHKKLSSTMEGARPRTDVYHLTVALYPLNFEEPPK